MAKKWLRISAEVQEALDSGRPVVALESTLISHGLPYPQNLETAQMLENTVREHGAVPATIAILKGVCQVGLTANELRTLAGSDTTRKVSRRDLPIIVAQKGNGATTVAATMAIAAMAGISVFATGGIGGVHRGQPFDVSADLVELSQTEVIVVCAGAKAILDLSLTLEWLETHGVPVLGYQTDTFPAFYTRSSGLPVDARVDNPQQVADIARLRWDMGLQGGLLVTVPVPFADAMPPDAVESAIQTALQDAESEGVRGKAVTPYLLARLVELTDGRSMVANIALLENNATVAAEISGAIAGAIAADISAEFDRGPGA
jgi:pseudouridine-5'-phosphate glycosidase